VNAEPLAGQGPAAERVAAAALVDLPSMTPARLRALLAEWPDARQAADAVLRRDGRIVDALERLRFDPRTGATTLAAGWSKHIDISRAAHVLTRRRTHVLLATDSDYPIPDPVPDRPAVLLAEGDHLEALDAPRVAIVGTRAASPHGLHDAFELGAFLARAGCTVVSGMAIGIDAAAHEGALEAGGRAVGVIATGLDVVYPRRHHILFERVRAHGCLLTESAFATSPEPGRFPVRNRIIAGIADAVVVVEATTKGGARITAERALEYDRPVLAVPGSRRNPAAAGCNALLADGAHPLLDPTDVLVALGMTPGARRGWDRRPEPSGDARRCLHACGGEPATVDQLAARTGLAPAELAHALAECERTGALRRSRGFLWPA
jgi:DNA processing protein